MRQVNVQMRRCQFASSENVLHALQPTLEAVEQTQAATPSARLRGSALILPSTVLPRGCTAPALAHQRRAWLAGTTPNVALRFTATPNALRTAPNASLALQIVSFHSKSAISRLDLVRATLKPTAKPRFQTALIAFETSKQTPLDAAPALPTKCAELTQTAIRIAISLSVNASRQAPERVLIVLRVPTLEAFATHSAGCVFSVYSTIQRRVPSARTAPVPRARAIMIAAPKTHARRRVMSRQASVRLEEVN